eukprot:gnl/Dysnectes_brevis/193_a222_6005.p1 GENE.gnl/Dysnectes_brevis/193_a222_6005~~gnl/Dysnectes_brevis/193_a222_6005.p1  ORF type:complete len:342 (-),score=131.25 gnl/Dysnectes_brevis/193_a222_6005:31-1056(-)
MTSTSTTIIITVGVILLITLIIILCKYPCIIVVREKESVVLESWGRPSRTLMAGIHLLMPIVNSPRRFNVRYFAVGHNDRINLISKKNIFRISTQAMNIDFPSTELISRDNAVCRVDMTMNYSVIDPRQRIYSVQNLPLLLSKLLQAHVRNRAGTMTLDQLIEQSQLLSQLQGVMDQEARRWGVRVHFIKVQKVECPNLSSDLAMMKTTKLKNDQAIINARSTKQSDVIKAEGQRDYLIKASEGQAQEHVLLAKGNAEKIRNAARAEATSVQEMARAMPSGSTSSPSEYFLAVKYLDVLKRIMGSKGVQVDTVPTEMVHLAAMKALELPVQMGLDMSSIPK